MRDDLTGGEVCPWLDPATEARVVALVLGEASDFEEDQLNRLVAKWPEIRLLKSRIEAVNELLEEVGSGKEEEEWRLGRELRDKLLVAMDCVSTWQLRAVGPGASRERAKESGQARSALSGAKPEGRPGRVRAGFRVRWRRVLAGCAALGAMLVAIFSPAIFEDESYEAETYSAAGMERRPAGAEAFRFADSGKEAVREKLAEKGLEHQLAELGSVLGSYEMAEDDEAEVEVRDIDGLRPAEPEDPGWGADPRSVLLQPGDVVVVPEKNWLGNGGGGFAEARAASRWFEGGDAAPDDGEDLPWPGEAGPAAARNAAVALVEPTGVEEGLEERVGVVQETLQKQLQLLESRGRRMRELVDERRSEAVDRALVSQDYLEAKREYDAAKAMLQTMKIHHSSKRIALKTPENPITIHEEGTEPVKKGGTIFGGGKYESEAVLEVNPSVLEVDPLAGATGETFTGSYPSRSYITSEFVDVTGESSLGKVVEKLDLDRKWGVSREEAVEELKQAVTVKKVEGTDLLGIKAKAKDPKEAQAIARTMAEVHRERRTREERDRAERALEALDEEVRIQEDLVEEKRKMFHTIVKAVGIPYLDGIHGSGQMGRSEERILRSAPREEYEFEEEKRQLEIQLESLRRLKGEELEHYLAGLEMPGMEATVRSQLRRQAEATDPEVLAAEEPFSTFSLHVSEVSFKLAKAALERGDGPRAEEIRVEEFVNAFDYGDRAPSMSERVSGTVEQAAHPFRQQRNLLRISVRTAAQGRSKGTPLRLTVLLDRSGSMERMDRAESVQRAFRVLAGQMTGVDQVTLIGFSRRPRLLADRMRGDEVAEFCELIARSRPEGGTNLEEALRLGMAMAEEQWREGAQNRIVLLTDGAANLGNADPELLAGMVEEMREKGIAFDACGVGAEGLNDAILESLTREGGGRYYFLDRPEDAEEGFARQIAGALRPAAENVKVQVRFNPARVGRYKLFGFEKHRLAKEDFRDDSVDAAELAAEEAGTALYQVEVLPEGRGPVGRVSVRFRDTASGQMVERWWTIPYDAGAPRLEEAGAGIRLAACAALLGEKLKGSAAGEAVEMARLARVAGELPSLFPASKRVQDLLEMIGKVRAMGPE